MDALLYVLTAQFVEKLPFVKKWQEERKAKDVQENHELYVRNSRARKYSRQIERRQAENSEKFLAYIGLFVVLSCFVIAQAVCGVY